MSRIVLIAALAIFGMTVSIANASDKSGIDSTCSDDNFRSDGTKEDTIRKILEWSACIKQQYKKYVGKYFCYTENEAGIQPTDKGGTFVGRIKPSHDKFFVTVSEIDESEKSEACYHEYGMLKKDFKNGVVQRDWRPDYTQYWGNDCVGNYKMSFSNSGFMCGSIVEPLGCSGVGIGTEGSFVWNKEVGKDFRLFTSDGVDQFYVALGVCEKID